VSRTDAPLVSFNRGLVSKLALARIDLERLRLSAEIQTNWMPRTLGPMSIRTGLKMICATNDDQFALCIPFVFAMDDTAAIEITDGAIRFLIDDELLTRESVATTVVDGDMTVSGGLGGWATVTSGSSSASFSGGLLTMAAPTLGGVATATNGVSVAADDRGTEHGLRVIIARGPILFRVGTTSGGSDLVSDTELETGQHSFSFTPDVGTFYIQFEQSSRIQAIVDSAQIESAGVVELPAPWGEEDFDYIRYTQSADVLFVGDGSHQQRRIERHDARSWSIVLYKPDSGPFGDVNTAEATTITPSANSGNITLTASTNIFNQDQVGGLIRITSTSQNITTSIAAENTFSDAIQVSGAGTERSFSVRRTGTFTATLTLQRSFDGPTAGFIDTSTTYTAVGTTDFEDAFDNVEVWYRVGVKTGDYTSGTVSLTLAYPSGGGPGVVRITAYTSPTSATAEVLTTLKSLSATSDFEFGAWSDDEGWPSATAIFDGRLWWAGLDKEWGSVSDDYENFDDQTEGDSGPILRSIGYGPVESINWLLPLQRLLVGTAASEISVRSSSFDEPLTPTNFSQKDCSTQGSAVAPAYKFDTRGVFIQRSRKRVFELAYSIDAQDYSAADLTQLVPDLAGSSTFVSLAVQRQPDTRIHAILADGTSRVLVFDPAENVRCWVKVETDGLIENAFVLPAESEDAVYYIVKRTIDGDTKRFIERFALQEDCVGQPDAHLADCHILYEGAASTTITGLSHLEGEEVVVWGWNTVTPFTATLPDGTTQTVGKDFGTFTVSSGQITGLSSAVTNACVGLGYTATFKSAKLAYGGVSGTALTKQKKLDQLGIILADTHCRAITYGQDLDHMDNMPLTEEGQTFDTNIIWTDYDKGSFSLNGKWDTDSRVCLEASAPKPATVLALVPTIKTSA
jgi:hypothetical protein